MSVPDELRYSEDHQWVRLEGDLVRVGLTDYAQDALGEITLVQLADAGLSLDAGAELGEVEAFKAMTDLYMPIAATVIEHNPVLGPRPECINEDPYGEGWLCTARPSAAGDVAGLLDASGYRSLIGEG